MNVQKEKGNPRDKKTKDLKTSHGLTSKPVGYSEAFLTTRFFTSLFFTLGVVLLLHH